MESDASELYATLVRDLYAMYPIAIRFVELLKYDWIAQNNADAETLYSLGAEIFEMWLKSQHFKREEMNFISSQELDINSLISSSLRGAGVLLRQYASAGSGGSSGGGSKKKQRRRDRKRENKRETVQSLIIIGLKRMLPIGMNVFTGNEQEIVQKGKAKLLQSEVEHVVEDFINTQLLLPDKPDPTDEKSWQKILYSKIGRKKIVDEDMEFGEEESNRQTVVSRILAMGKVLHGLHLVSIDEIPDSALLCEPLLPHPLTQPRTDRSSRIRNGRFQTLDVGAAQARCY